MGTSFSPFFFRRNQALSPVPNTAEPPPPNMPDVDPIETLLEDSLLNTPPGEQAQRDLPLPNQADYTPSTGRKILSVIASALGGYSEGAAAGIGMGRAVLDSPYKNAMARYTEKAKALGNIAGLEEKELGRKRLGWGSILDRRARIAAEKGRNEDRDAAREDRKLKQEENERGRYRMGANAQGEMRKYDMQTGTSVPFTDAETGKPEMGKVSDKVQTAAQALDQTILDAEALDGLLNEHKDTLWLGGMGQGAIGEAWNRNISGDPKRSDMYRLMQKIANTSLYELSGAQINNKEYDRLRKTLADPKSSEGAIFADMAAFLKSAKNQRERFKTRGVWSEEALSGQGDPTSSSSSTPNPTSSPTPGAAPPKRKYTIKRM